MTPSTILRVSVLMMLSASTSAFMSLVHKPFSGYCQRPLQLVWKSPTQPTDCSRLLGATSGEDETDDETRTNLPNIVSAKEVISPRECPTKLPDRFKYSVNALMGLYDPPSPEEDNENDQRDSMAISKALLKWPQVCEFVAVGEGHDFAMDCAQAVSSALSVDQSSLAESMKTKETGRFTRVQMFAEIADPDILTTVYSALDTVAGIKFKY